MQLKVITHTHPPSSKPGLSHGRMAPIHHNGSLCSSDCISELTLIHPTRAMIKKAMPGDKIASENLERECRTYRLPGVASATCFRQLYDVFDNHTIALERLDSTLAGVKYQPNMRTYAIIKAVVKETLTSCVVLDRQQYVNTGEISSSNLLKFANRQRL